MWGRDGLLIAGPVSNADSRCVKSSLGTYERCEPFVANVGSCHGVRIGRGQRATSRNRELAATVGLRIVPVIGRRSVAGGSVVAGRKVAGFRLLNLVHGLEARATDIDVDGEFTGWTLLRRGFGGRELVPHDDRRGFSRGER